ncbi:hypothetical protein [Streptomyces wedmorensis]
MLTLTRLARAALLLGFLAEAGEQLDDRDRAAARRYLLAVAVAYRKYLAGGIG